MKSLHSIKLTKTYDQSGFYFPAWPARARTHHYYEIRYTDEERREYSTRIGNPAANGQPLEIRLGNRYLQSLCGRNDRCVLTSDHYSWFNLCQRCQATARRRGLRDTLYTRNDPFTA